jgi:hypothetical protein
MLFSLIQTAHSSGGIDKEGEDELDGNGEKIVKTLHQDILM